MPKRVTSPLLGALPQSADAAGLPLHLQLYHRLRDAMVSGAFAPGSRLPSSRVLARDLQVSRNTVESALEQLRAEGFITRRVGAGSYVADSVGALLGAGRAATRARRAPAPRTPAGGTPPSLSARGRALAARSTAAPRPRVRAFARALPAVEDFPHAVWSRILARRARHGEEALWKQSDAAGFEPLRRAVAAHLAASRGVRCDWRRVIVVASTQQAMDLAGRLLLDPGDTACLEDPCYPGARAAFANAGAHIAPVAVDDHGMTVRASDAAWRGARLAYTTPSHQYPLGMTLSLPRRLALLEWAERADGWIFEDDYDSEFRYAGRPVTAVQGLDRAGRVLYAGSFNKLLFPAVRVGYLVVPHGLVDAAAAALDAASGPPATLLQAAMADFILAGHLAGHIRAMRDRYRERRDVLLDALRAELGDAFMVIAAETGLHITGWLPCSADDAAISRRATAAGLDVPALSSFHAGAAPRPGLVVNFAHVSAAVIPSAVVRLAGCIAHELRRR